tara:strand:- start:11604 stop:12353 length:750 start_codon:yes stop_codon:yes gene_type:complete
MRIIFKFINKFFLSKKEKGSLTIIGVGPGDPSYLTIEATKALKKSKVIFYPISGEDKISYSKKIVRKYIKNKKQIPLIFPMATTKYDSEVIWKNSAKEIAAFITKEIPVSLLCLGDTSIYASSFYLKDEIKKNYPDIKITTLPGISSLSLAAALGDFQLVKKGENLNILECPDDKDQLLNLINKQSKTVLAIMKVGKRWEWVKYILDEKKILRKAILAVNLGMENQYVGAASEYLSEELPYFSLLLLRI